MHNFRSRSGMLFYMMALAVQMLGIGYLISVHFPIWFSGNIVLSAFSGGLVLLYVLASHLLWALGHLLKRRPKLDLALLLLTIVPIAMLLIVPSRFSVN